MASDADCSGPWEKLANLPRGSFWRPKAFDKDTIIVSAEDGIYSYNASKDDIQKIIPLPSAAENSSAVDSHNKVLYHQRNSKLYRFDLSTNKLISCTSNLGRACTYYRFQMEYIEGTLHLFGGVMNRGNLHYIWNEEQSTFVHMHEFGYFRAHKRGPTKVYSKKSRSIFCFEKNDDNFYVIREYNLLKDQWTAYTLKLPIEMNAIAINGVASVRDDEYILIVDGWSGGIFAFNVSKRKMYKSKVMTPVRGWESDAVVISSSLDPQRADVIISGFIRPLWRDSDFKCLGFPGCLIGLFATWISFENLHFVSYFEDHYRISVDYILAEIHEVKWQSKSRGICKKFDCSKGYGFIKMDDGSGDIFVHSSEIQTQGLRILAVGEVVEFTVVTQEDGRRKAVNVTGPNGVDIQRQRQQQFGQTIGIGSLSGGGVMNSSRQNNYAVGGVEYNGTVYYGGNAVATGGYNAMPGTYSRGFHGVQYPLQRVQQHHPWTAGQHYR